jgi:predicted RNA-binding Zn-ribbon protein involved in translation (DUF1610 family)
MGLGHLFGLGHGRVHVRCRDCGYLGPVDPDAEAPTCPDCGSTDCDRLAIA